MMKRILFTVFTSLFLLTSTRVFADKIIIDNDKPMEELGAYILNPLAEGTVELQIDTSVLGSGWWGPFPLSILTDSVEKYLVKNRITLYDSLGKESVGYEIPPTIFKEYPDVTITTIPKRIESRIQNDPERNIAEITWLRVVLDEWGVAFTIDELYTKDALVETKLWTTVTVIADTDWAMVCHYDVGCDFFADYTSEKRLEIFEKLMNAMKNKKPLRMKGRLEFSSYVDFSEEHGRMYVFFTVTEIE